MYSPYLECSALQTLYCKFKVAQQERPGVDKVDPVHGYHDNTIPTLEAPGQTVFDKEGVWEHKSMLLISKENRSFTARTHLRKIEMKMKLLCCVTHRHLHKHYFVVLPHSWGCVRRPAAPHWKAVAAWDAGGSGSECLSLHQRSQSLGEMQAEIDNPMQQEKEKKNNSLRQLTIWICIPKINTPSIFCISCIVGEVQWRQRTW